MQTLNVDLGARSYPIHIGSGLISDISLMAPHIKGRQVMIVSNTTVAPLYLDQLKATLGEQYQIAEVILPDGEVYKTLDSVNLIFNALLENRFNRTCTLIALGGGVVGDMTGFAAASYQRGVNFIQIPTTLLSQVDSSVGGKTGVNHPLGKNMIGAFWQPQLVLADTGTLQTLPDRELAAGIAEVIKYGLIRDADFFSWLESNVQPLKQKNNTALSEAIYRSCQNKAGWLNPGDVARIKALLEKFDLPVTPPDSMTAETFIKHMRVDKKVLDGNLRLVLMAALGKSVITEQFSEANLQQTLVAGKKLGFF